MNESKRSGFGVVAVVVGLGFAAALWSCAPQAGEGPEAAEAIAMSNVDPSLLSALEWRFVGPVRGGRVVAVAGDPADPLVFYFGSAHGGVWKTVDAGITWRNVSDGYFNVAPIGAIAVSRSNSQVIYAGTGEGIPRQHISPGDGVYKSTDGGATWTNVGLADTRHISDLLIHPRNPDIVYVAAKGDMFGPSEERGVYRTRDGGRTWEKVLYRNDLAGAGDITMDPTNPNVLIAALNYHVRLPWDETGGGPASGLYKTTDGGDSWTELTGNPGLPQGVVGEIGVDISPARPSRVYAIIEAADGGIYRSDNGGATWTRGFDERVQRFFPASYNHIAADTEDPDVVYVLHQAFWKSTDGGMTFTTRRLGHSDHHALWIDPSDSRRMINGNDGGAQVTLNGGTSWSGLENQPTADLFSLAIDDQEPYWLYFSQNDNSHIGIPSQSNSGSIGRTDYLDIPQGEGGQTAVRPDGSVVYGGDRTSIIRFDLKSGQGQDISVWPDDEFGDPIKDVKERFYYSFPILLSSFDPGVLYTASQYLYRSTDEGNSWARISPDLSRNRQEVMGKIPGGPITSIASSLYYVSLIRAIEESPLDANELWVGTDDSTVQYTTDGGGTWQNVSPPDMPEWTTITAVDVSAHHKGTAYVAGGRHRMSDRAPYLYKTTDYGQTWQKITNGIGDIAFTYVIREDPVRPGLLYAGTEIGAYVSFDDGANWQPLQRNLPVVGVMFMQVKDDDLVIGTHGRGAWIMDNVSALRQLTPEVAASPVHLFAVAPATRNLAAPLGPAREAPGEGKNPPGGVVIEYYLAEQPAEGATLAILDAAGAEIMQFSSQERGSSGMPAAAGTNRFVWDLSYSDPPAPPRSVPLSGFEATQPSGPVAAPGRFTARLTVGGQALEQPFEIRKDPRVLATDADLQAQFTLLVDISTRASEAVDGLNRLYDARGQIDTANPTAAAVLERLLTIEGQLQRLTGSHSLELAPKGLYNRLGTLSRAVLSADARPTQQEYAVFEELSAGIAEQLRQLDEVIANEVPGVAKAAGGGGA
ncbi:MAG: hypothetical protein Q8N53_05435 [Longimicrobiales bacterium]|nr:hypothetical protein [Longimicrobiales bacterium]